MLRAVPYQEAPRPPMTEALAERCARAVHVMTPEGKILAAGRASLLILDTIGWRRTAAVLSHRSLIWFVELVYKIVARNRSFFGRVTRFVGSTPNRTFLLYPLLLLAAEFVLRRGRLDLDLRFLPLLLWGYLQYKLCGLYRIRRGGGGPGLETPPERLVSSGPYAYTRNPMYLGHIIFLVGLTLSLRSVLSALLTVGVAVWFHARVRKDERRLAERLGEPYRAYCASVKRWIPGLF